MTPSVHKPETGESSAPLRGLVHAEEVLSAMFFYFSLLFLLDLAGLSHRYSRPDVLDWEVRLMGGALLILWPIFVAEAGIRWYLAWRAGRCAWGLLQALLIVLAPPLRLGFRGYYRQEEIWLPGFGWQKADKQLYTRLEKGFSVPMIILALLVLPILVLEYGWPEWREEYVWFGLTLDAASALIWVAFATEFILLFSLSNKKIQFCFRHWIELLIVTLPLMEVLPMMLTDFVPALRFLRVLRLQQLGRLGRMYRLRALLTKMWRAFLILELVQRLTGQTPEKRLRRLRELLAAKLEEVEELQREIAQLEAQVKNAQGAAEGTMSVKGHT